MNDVVIGKSKLAGKGTYAGRDFKQGERVIRWMLKEIDQSQFDALPKDQQTFVHSFWGKMYRFPKPACYTNHSAHANTIANYEDMCDYATKPIKKGEMITTNATEEFKFEVKTFIEANEENVIVNFQWLKGGYRNAVVSYKVANKLKKLTLKRNGNWQIVKERVEKVK